VQVISAYDRLTYEWSYRVLLPCIRRAIRVLPGRLVRLLADRSDRREAQAHYVEGMQRVGILRRYAIDRYDVRADTNVTYYTELRRRGEGS